MFLPGVNLLLFLLVNICNFLQNSAPGYYCTNHSKNSFIKDFLWRAENKLEPTLIDKLIIAVVDMERVYRRHLTKSHINSCCLKIVGDANRLICIYKVKDLYYCLNDLVYKFAEIVENATMDVDDILLEACHDLIKVDADRGRKRQDYLQRGTPRKIYLQQIVRASKHRKRANMSTEPASSNSLSADVFPSQSFKKGSKRIHSSKQGTYTSPYSTSGLISLSNWSIMETSQTHLRNIKMPRVAIYGHPQPSLDMNLDYQSSLSRRQSLFNYISSKSNSEPVGMMIPSFSPHQDFSPLIQRSNFTKITLHSLSTPPEKILQSSIYTPVFTTTGISHPPALTVLRKQSSADDIISSDVTSSDFTLYRYPKEISTFYSLTQDISSANFDKEAFSKLYSGSSNFTENVSKDTSNNSAGVLEETIKQPIPQSKEYDDEYDEEYWKKPVEMYNYPFIG